MKIIALLRSQILWVIAGILAILASIGLVYHKGTRDGRSKVHAEQDKEIEKRRDRVKDLNEELEKKDYDKIIDDHL